MPMERERKTALDHVDEVDRIKHMVHVAAMASLTVEPREHRAALAGLLDALVDDLADLSKSLRTGAAHD